MGKLDLRILMMVALTVAILGLISFRFPGGDEESGPFSVTLVIDFGTHHPQWPHPRNHTVWERGCIIASHPAMDAGTIYEFRNITGENHSVLDVLKIAAHWSNMTVETTAYPSMNGVFVDAIAGVENGGANWRYSVNGVYGTHASDLRKVADDDRILWEYR